MNSYPTGPERLPTSPSSQNQGVTWNPYLHEPAFATVFLKCVFLYPQHADFSREPMQPQWLLFANNAKHDQLLLLLPSCQAW